MSSTRLDQQEEPLLAMDDFETEDEDDPSAMSLVDHLEELRWRLFKAIIAILVGGVIAFIFRDQLMLFLQAPLPKEANALYNHGQGGKLVVTGLAEGFTVFLKVSFVAGMILALPVLLYQTWAFIAPGLYEREKKYAVPFIFIGVVLFLIGVSLGYIVLRYPLEWLVTFAASSFVSVARQAIREALSGGDVLAMRRSNRSR